MKIKTYRCQFCSELHSVDSVLALDGFAGGPQKYLTRSTGNQWVTREDALLDHCKSS